MKNYIKVIVSIALVVAVCVVIGSLKINKSQQSEIIPVGGDSTKLTEIIPVGGDSSLVAETVPIVGGSPRLE